MKLIIDRNIWLRGEKSDKSQLLRSSDNKRCCLGIYLGQCGIEDKYIRDVNIPENLSEDLKQKIPPWLLTPTRKSLISPSLINSKKTENLIYINDSESISDDFREKQIKDIFASKGIEVEFIN